MCGNDWERDSGSVSLINIRITAEAAGEVVSYPFQKRETGVHTSGSNSLLKIKSKKMK